MEIDRVLLASNNDETYRQFWPLVARAWRKLTDFTPTLIKLGDFEIDETLGEVVRLPAIEGIPTGFFAQVARLLVPALYPDQVSLTSDVDMLPLKGDYFRKQVVSVPDDHIVLYSSDAYPGQPKYPICYIAAKGSVLAEIVGLGDRPDLTQVQAKIKEWYARGLGWNTDELMLARLLHEWKHFPARCVLLNRGGMGSVRF